MWENQGRHSVGKPRLRCMDVVEENLRAMRVTYWRRWTMDVGYGKWQKILEEADMFWF